MNKNKYISLIFKIQIYNKSYKHFHKKKRKKTIEMLI